jgi:hypothetical protein
MVSSIRHRATAYLGTKNRPESSPGLAFVCDACALA